MLLFRTLGLALLALALPGFATATSPFLVYFEQGSAELSNRGERTIENVARILLIDCPGSQILLVGHDDNMLSADESTALSKARVQMVAARLQELRVSNDRLNVIIRGQSQPARVTPKGTAEVLNRRVEIGPIYCAD